jgi:hypothetical protein
MALIEDTGRTKALLPENAPAWHHWLSRTMIASSTGSSIMAALGHGPLIGYWSTFPDPTTFGESLALGLVGLAVFKASHRRPVRIVTRLNV